MLEFASFTEGGSSRPFCRDVLVPEHREPTSGLELLSCSLRVIGQALQGCAGGANPVYLSDFLCPGLLSVAPYCVPGGSRVVSEGHLGLGSSGVGGPWLTRRRLSCHQQTQIA